jgi:hypothetical protein
MATLRAVAQPFDCPLPHTLLAYWRGLLVQMADLRSERAETPCCACAHLPRWIARDSDARYPPIQHPSSGVTVPPPNGQRTNW